MGGWEGAYDGRSRAMPGRHFLIAPGADVREFARTHSAPPRALRWGPCAHPGPFPDDEIARTGEPMAPAPLPTCRPSGAPASLAPGGGFVDRQAALWPSRRKGASRVGGRRAGNAFAPRRKRRPPAAYSDAAPLMGAWPIFSRNLDLLCIPERQRFGLGVVGSSEIGSHRENCAMKWPDNCPALSEGNIDSRRRVGAMESVSTIISLTSATAPALPFPSHRPNRRRGVNTKRTPVGMGGWARMRLSNLPRGELY